MYERIVLPNGARIVCEHMDGVRSASLGIWVGAGSRYERYSEAGSAHFIEHMLFKEMCIRDRPQLPLRIWRPCRPLLRGGLSR